MLRLGRRMEREGHSVPGAWWEGPALQQNLLALHLYEARLRRTDLTVSERRLWEENAHQMRELVVRLGGLPGRGING